MLSFTPRRQIRRARSLRGADTPAEARLWTNLRGRRLQKFKFVRQVPIGPYIADFLCRETRLIVEVDGRRIRRIGRSFMIAGVKFFLGLKVIR